MRSVLLALLPFALASCVSAPPARHAHGRAVVFGPTAERAAAVAEEVDGYVRRLDHSLPRLDGATIEVWLQDRPQVFWFFPFDGEVAAATNHLTHRIHAADASPDLSVELAHETLHMVLGNAWDGLPPTLEEGLCDQMAARISDDGSDLAVDRLIRAMAATGGPPLRLRMDMPDGGWAAHEVRVTFETSPGFDLRDTFSRRTSQVRPLFAQRERTIWYGTAYVAAGRLLDTIGADGLLRLCEVARDLDDDASTALFAESAGLGSDPRAWHDAIEETFGETERRALIRRIAPMLAVETAAAVLDLPGDAPLLDRVRAANVRLQVGSPDRCTPVLDVPEVAEILRMHAPAAN